MTPFIVRSTVTQEELLVVHFDTYTAVVVDTDGYLSVRETGDLVVEVAGRDWPVLTADGRQPRFVRSREAVSA